MREPAAVALPSRSRRRWHAVVYDCPERAVAGVRALRTAGFRVHDVHSPFPVHGMSEALGLEPTRIPYATLGGAVVGGSIALGFQLWSHAVDWPLHIGGKDLLALPALVPVTFEVAVLLAAFATVIALALTARLSPRATAPTQPLPAVSDDRFVVVVEERDASFSSVHFLETVVGSGAAGTSEWRVE